MEKIMRIVDLFAGCGGMSLGFQSAGFEVVGAFEFWKQAVDCYARNFNHPVFQIDLSDVDNAVDQIKKMQPDIIIGGPPCQDFSHAGKRIEDKRAGLTGSFAIIVSRIAPKWFVMENVDRAQKSDTYAIARKILKDAGYGLTEIVLDASYCGVPQRRKRFFCIGSLGCEDGFLDGYIREQMDEKEMTVRDYFGSSLDFEYYYRHPRNYSRRAIFSIDEPAPTIRGVNRPIPKGYPGHPNDACELKNSIRPMTTLERALIQTFPADFKWHGNKTEMEQMIGNAVPVKLAEFIARALLHHINSHTAGSAERTVDLVDYDGFYNWILSTLALSERAVRDTISRLKRAGTIRDIPPMPDAYYLFELEQSEMFRGLTSTVRSQMKRAVTLYSRFCGAIRHERRF